MRGSRSTLRRWAGRLYPLKSPAATVVAMRGLRRVLVVMVLAVSALIAGCSTAPVSTQPTVSIVPTFSAQASLEDQFIAAVGKVSPSVVAIQTGTGLGSGVIFDVQGDIVTNA